ncbi:MAG: hypothetical protein JRM71_05535 [Nitrososphaerota archaeon]|nr:hypothetical protein [Nitrososphaerota archaeon]MDG7010240.1 hypothetical protein [Nitrososphaerota archaeon]
MNAKAPKRRRIPKSFWVRAAYSFALIVGVEVVGTVTMHFIEGWSLLDSFYFTSFIATGQGPPSNLLVSDPTGKVFSSVLAFVSVGTVITALLFLFGPFLGAIMREGEEMAEEVGKELRGVGVSTLPGGRTGASPGPSACPNALPAVPSPNA